MWGQIGMMARSRFRVGAGVCVLNPMASPSADPYSTLHFSLSPSIRRGLALAASTHGTPLYAYLLPVVRARTSALCHALHASSEDDDTPPSRPLSFSLMYALKACNAPAVVRCILATPGVIGLDVVSLGELLLGLSLGARRLLFTNNNVSAGELYEACDLAAAHAGRVFINCDSLGSVRCLAARYAGAPASLPRPELFLRVNGGSGGGHHAHVVTAGENSKFGLLPAELPLALAAAAAGLAQRAGSVALVAPA